MIRKNALRSILVVLSGLMLFSVTFALAANNVVPVTHLTDQWRAVTISELAPPECDSIRNTLVALRVCTSSGCPTTNASELILGTAGPDVIDGGHGNDCIVGGDGDDYLYGDKDDDVLIGGSGDDTLNGGQKKDMNICYGGPGTNVLNECDVTP